MLAIINHDHNSTYYMYKDPIYTILFITSLRTHNKLVFVDQTVN